MPLDWTLNSLSLSVSLDATVKRRKRSPLATHTHTHADGTLCGSVKINKCKVLTQSDRASVTLASSLVFGFIHNDHLLGLFMMYFSVN